MMAKSGRTRGPTPISMHVPHGVVVLRSWEGQGHVPYTQNRTQILDETRNFFYSQMDLAHAAR